MIDSGVTREEVPPGYQRTEVGVIPGEWKVASLGEIATIVTGNTPPTHDPTNYGDDYPFVSPTDLGETKYVADTNKKLSKKGFETSRRFPANSILFVSIGSTIGKCGIAPAELTSNQQINAVFPSCNFSADYLYYTLCSIAPRIRALAGEQAVPIVNKTQFSKTIVPLPPLPEQRTIAAALSDAEGLIGALDALIEKKRAIKQAVMQQLLTGKKRLPGFAGEWETKRLGDIITFLPTANNPRADLNDDGEIQYIHYGDVHAQTEPVLDCNVCVLPYIDRGKIGNAAYLEDGDLIMVDASEDLEGTGKSVEVQGISGKNVIAGLHTILCRGNSDQWARGFKAYLQFIPAFKLALTRIATGISVYAISKKQIAEIELALPPVSEQDAIVSILSDMDAEIAALERRREKTKQIKQGTMQQLLTGRIRLVEPLEAAA